MRAHHRWAVLGARSRAEPAVRRLVFAGYELRPPRCRFVYRYERATYASVLTFEGVSAAAFRRADPELLDLLLGHVGLAFAPRLFTREDFTHLTAEAVPLTPLGRDLFADLFRQGLAELRYRNGLDLTRDVVLEAPERRGGRPGEAAPGAGALLFGGGGKDSAVGAEALRAAAAPFAWLAVNPSPAVAATAAAAGVSEVLAVASAGPPLARHGRRRFHGHRPFSSWLAFVGITAAYLTGRRWVVASNERSASFPTLVHGGVEVNHQHTKSYGFETRLRDYLAADLVSGISYFSVLRPLWEIEIGRLFAGLPRYHRAVVSCNRGLHAGRWCLACAKCAFVFLLLAAFLPPTAVAAILGGDPAASPALRRHVAALTLRDRRPFDCVGTLGECRLALALAAANGFLPLAREAGWEVPSASEAADLAQIYLKDGLQGGDRPHHIPEEIREPVLGFLAARRGALL